MIGSVLHEQHALLLIGRCSSLQLWTAHIGHSAPQHSTPATARYAVLICAEHRHWSPSLIRICRMPPPSHQRWRPSYLIYVACQPHTRYFPSLLDCELGDGGRRNTAGTKRWYNAATRRDGTLHRRTPPSSRVQVHGRYSAVSYFTVPSSIE